MGQRTDQAERDVQRQRELISRRLEELSAQVGHSVDGAGRRLREQVSSVRQQVAESADRVPGKRTLQEAVPAHPLSSMLGGFGAGVALGMLHAPGDGRSSNGHSSSGHGERKSRASNGDGRSEARDDGDGFVDRLSAVALGSLMGPVQQRLGDLAEEAVAGFIGRSTNGSGQRRDRGN